MIGIIQKSFQVRPVELAHVDEYGVEFTLEVAPLLIPGEGPAVIAYISGKALEVPGRICEFKDAGSNESMRLLQLMPIFQKRISLGTHAPLLLVSSHSGSVSYRDS